MNEHLKKHFADLLFEEYKLSSFIWKMMSMGVNMERLDVKNHEIVCDMIGFPPDNTLDFDIDESDDETPPADYFCRDWLSDRFGSLSIELSENRDIVLSEKGLQVRQGDDEHVVRDALSRHVNWLFNKYTKLDKN